MSDDILQPSVTDPRGERQLEAVAAQDLSVLSVGDLQARITLLKEAIAQAEKELKARDGAASAAEALFRK